MKIALDISVEMRGVVEVDVPQEMIDDFVNAVGHEPTDGELRSVIEDHVDREEILDVATGNLMTAKSNIDFSYTTINATWRPA